MLVCCRKHSSMDTHPNINWMRCNAFYNNLPVSFHIQNPDKKLSMTKICNKPISLRRIANMINMLNHVAKYIKYTLVTSAGSRHSVHKVGHVWIVHRVGHVWIFTESVMCKSFTVGYAWNTQLKTTSHFLTVKHWRLHSQASSSGNKQFVFFKINLILQVNFELRI